MFSVFVSEGDFQIFLTVIGMRFVLCVNLCLALSHARAAGPTSPRARFCVQRTFIPWPQKQLRSWGADEARIPLCGVPLVCPPAGGCRARSSGHEAPLSPEGSARSVSLCGSAPQAACGPLGFKGGLRPRLLCKSRSDTFSNDLRKLKNSLEWKNSNDEIVEKYVI